MKSFITAKNKLILIKMPHDKKFHFKYGFEIEQRDIPQSLRNATASGSGRLSRFGGHHDSGNWEIASFRVAHYGNVIKQFDEIFFDSSLNSNISSSAKYPRPFTWKNKNAGSHIHVSLNFSELSQGKYGYSMEAVNLYLRDWVNLHNMFVMFYGPMMTYLTFRDPIRDIQSPGGQVHSGGFYSWANIPTRITNLRAFINSWCISSRITGHPYVSPSIRIQHVSQLGKFGATQDFIRLLQRNNFRQFPVTIELRANENHYFWAGEMLRRSLNFFKFEVAAARNKEKLVGSPSMASKNKLLKEEHNRTNIMVKGLLKATDIDLGKEMGKDKFILKRKYPTLLHLAIEFNGKLQLFGSQWRQIPALYQRIPRWRRKSHDILWHARTLIRKGMPWREYLDHGFNSGPFRFDNKRWSVPNNYVKDTAELRIFRKEVRDYNSGKQSLAQILSAVRAREASKPWVNQLT